MAENKHHRYDPRQHAPVYPARDRLVAFFEEHRRCGDLDGGAEDGRL